MANSGVDGLDALQARFNKMIRDVGPQGHRGLMDVAQELKGLSQAIVPHDTGDLEGAADVRPQPDGSVEVGYYGKEYAWEQHENLEYEHEPGRQAKYLEQPFEENLDRFVKHVADSVKKAF